MQLPLKWNNSTESAPKSTSSKFKPWTLKSQPKSPSSQNRPMRPKYYAGIMRGCLTKASIQNSVGPELVTLLVWDPVLLARSCKLILCAALCAGHASSAGMFLCTGTAGIFFHYARPARKLHRARTLARDNKQNLLYGRMLAKTSWQM